MSIPLISMSSTEMQQLADMDFLAFKNHFNRLLPQVDPVKSVLMPAEVHAPHMLAQMLRATSASLIDLDVEPSVRNYQSDTNPHKWVHLGYNLNKADSDDAIVIFRAMAKLLRDCDVLDCIDFMEEVFKHPAWRIRAIQEMPEFFRLHLPENTSDYDKHPKEPPANAFQVVAQAGEFKCNESRESIRELLQALKVAGVKDTLSPKYGECCLHCAASTKHPFLLNAFIDEFPGDVNKFLGQNSKRFGNWDTAPLSLAIVSGRPQNVRILLDAGANPNPSDLVGQSHLEFALFARQYKCAIELMASGAYSDDEIEEACANNFMDNDGFKHVRALQASLKARRVMDVAGHENGHPIRSL